MDDRGEAGGTESLGRGRVGEAATSVEPPAAGPQRYWPTRLQARLVQVFLGLQIVVIAVDLVLLALVVFSVDSLRDLRSDDLEQLLALANLVALLRLVLFVLAAIAFLGWQYRATANVVPLGGGTPRISPRAAVLWWFVPFANLVMPSRAIRDVYERMAVGQGGSARVSAWWGTFIGSNILVALGDRVVGQTTDVSLFYLGSLLVGLGTALLVVAALFAILVVAEIERRQSTRAAAMGIATQSRVQPVIIGGPYSAVVQPPLWGPGDLTAGAPSLGASSRTTSPARIGAVIVVVVALMAGSAVGGAFVFSVLNARPTSPTVRPIPSDQAGPIARRSPTASAPGSAPTRTGTPTPTDFAPSELTLYSSFPRRGSMQLVTDSLVNAITMALEAHDGSAGGAAVTHVDLDDYDVGEDFTLEQLALANARNAIDDPTAVGFIGPFGLTTVRELIPVLCEGGLAMIGPTNTSAGLTKPGKGEGGEPDRYYPGCRRNFFRPTPADDVQGLLAAAWAEHLGAQRIATVVDEALSIHHVALEFEREATRRGIDIVAHAVTSGPIFEPASLIDQVVAGEPDVVFFAANPGGDLAGLWSGIKARLPGVTIIAVDWVFSDDFFLNVADQGEGTLLTTAQLPAEALPPAGQTFIAEYTNRFGGAPDPFAPYAYEAADVFLTAIDRAAARSPTDLGEYRALVLEEVAATRDHSGVLPSWSFDSNGDTTFNALAAYEVIDGAWVHLGSIDDVIE